MGIDVYLEWEGMTAEDVHKQSDAVFSTLGGNVGFLHEAHHGPPYPSEVLVREAVKPPYVAKISASVMADRMQATAAAVRQRYAEVYETTDPSEVEPVIWSYYEFVLLAQRKEDETGALCDVLCDVTYDSEFTMEA